MSLDAFDYLMSQIRLCSSERCEHCKITREIAARLRASLSSGGGRVGEDGGRLVEGVLEGSVEVDPVGLFYRKGGGGWIRIPDVETRRIGPHHLVASFDPGFTMEVGVEYEFVWREDADAG